MPSQRELRRTIKIGLTAEALVRAYFPQAFANQISVWGNRTKGWHVHIPGIRDVRGMTEWHFRGKTEEAVWQAAADAVKSAEARRVDRTGAP